MKIRSFLPWPIFYFLKKLRAFPEDFIYFFKFLFKSNLKISFFKKLWIIYKCYRISYSVDCPHMEGEMIQVISAMLSYIDKNIPGVFVEAGSVSYTHLRAHETRHDLVCRLLLEKKKI